MIDFVVLYRNEIWIKELFIVLGLKRERASSLANPATVGQDEHRKNRASHFCSGF